MPFSKFPRALFRYPVRMFSVFILVCVLVTAGASFAGEDEGSSIWKLFDKLSIEEPTDRHAIQSALGVRADYLMIYGGGRMRLSRRFNLVGTMSSTVFEDAEDPNYFGFHFSAQEDVIVRPNGRIYVCAGYTVYIPSASSTSAWQGETLNEIGVGFGISQGFGFISMLRLFYEGTWNVTGKGTWRRPGTNGGQDAEQKDDFTGYQFVFGSEFIF